jgi:hypothetical protein
MFSNGAKLAIAISAVAFVVSAGGAQAASFAISSGGTPENLNQDFNPDYLSISGNNPDNIHGGSGIAGTPITTFSNGNVGGLQVIGANALTTVTYTYLGTEAAYTNLFMVGGSTIFQNHDTSSPLTSATVGGTTTGSFSVAPGNSFLSFLFRTTNPGNKDAINGISIDVNTLLAVALVGPNTAYLFFEDIAIGGDHDLDDLVVRADLAGPNGVNNPTPIPGAAWLFGSAVAGVAGIGRWRRRRRNATTT